MGVDQSRRHGQAAQIVDLGPLWDRPANAFDLVARDDDHGVSLRPALAVEQGGDLESDGPLGLRQLPCERWLVRDAQQRR